MQRGRWYRIALLLPIIVPAFIGELQFLGHVKVGFFSVFLVSSIFFAGAQYIGLSLGVFMWFRRKTSQQIQQLSWLLPLIFVPICNIPIAILVFFGDLVDGDKSNFQNIYVLIPITIVIIIIGYFYVLLAHGLTWAFQKAGWIKD